ncbi:MAG: putative rane protein [Ramlibacter sp.]|nr:putative rane protein [Ramlibacter sp.]
MTARLPARPAQRYDSIDALRGVAIVWMTVFHFCFDLTHFGFMRQDFYDDPFWTWQRSAIVSLFLFCAGLGQAVAVHQHQPSQRFWKRWAQVTGCALLVTAGSYFVFPNSFIYFGVLHGIALMLVIVRFSANCGRWLWLAGAVAIAAKLVAVEVHGAWPAADFLNSKPWNWLGLISRKPVTEDYVPLIPWLGVMWWGMAAGQWLLRHRREMLVRGLPRAAAPLAWLGRWSLPWYMLHQPLLFGILLSLR